MRREAENQRGLGISDAETLLRLFDEAAQWPSIRAAIRLVLEPEEPTAAARAATPAPALREAVRLVGESATQTVDQQVADRIEVDRPLLFEAVMLAAAAPVADDGVTSRKFTRWFLQQDRGRQADWMRAIAPSLSDLTGWEPAARLASEPRTALDAPWSDANGDEVERGAADGGTA